MDRKEAPEYPYWNFRARQRQLGVEVTITSEEWLAWWAATGKWDQRGPDNYQWCMARIDKKLGFSLDNIHCIQNIYNR